MKRILIFLLIFISLSGLFAKEKTSICVFPSNNEISSYVNNYFNGDIKSVSCSLKVENQDLETGDKQLMNLICDLSKADFAVLPIKSELADFHHLVLYGYNRKEEKFEKLFESLSQDNYEFGIDTVYRIAQFVLGEEEFKNFSLPEADSEISEIKIPVSSGLLEKPQWMKDKKIYSDARNSFYVSFARTIGLFGLKALSRSLSDYNFDCLATGAICISATDMVKKMFDYFRYADYISP